MSLDWSKILQGNKLTGRYESIASSQRREMDGLRQGQLQMEGLRRNILTYSEVGEYYAL